MKYVGIDHVIGLSCGSCNYTTHLLYSRLLNCALGREPIVCGGCGRVTNHGWESVEEARTLVSRCMRETPRARSMKHA